jgi:hypothetical protein
MLPYAVGFSCSCLSGDGVCSPAASIPTQGMAALPPSGLSHRAVEPGLHHKVLCLPPVVQQPLIMPAPIISLGTAKRQYSNCISLALSVEICQLIKTVSSLSTICLGRNMAYVRKAGSMFTVFFANFHNKDFTVCSLKALPPLQSHGLPQAPWDQELLRDGPWLPLRLCRPHQLACCTLRAEPRVCGNMLPLGMMVWFWLGSHVLPRIGIHSLPGALVLRSGFGEDEAKRMWPASTEGPGTNEDPLKWVKNYHIWLWIAHSHLFPP